MRLADYVVAMARVTTTADDGGIGDIDWVALSGWVIGAVSLVVAFLQLRRQQQATEAVAFERARFKRLELLHAFDEMENLLPELDRAVNANDSMAAAAALGRWRGAARVALGHLGPNGSSARVKAWEALTKAERATQDMAGRGGTLKFGAKTMSDALAAVDRCATACSKMRADTHDSVYGV